MVKHNPPPPGYVRQDAAAQRVSMVSEELPSAVVRYRKKILAYSACYSYSQTGLAEPLRESVRRFICRTKSRHFCRRSDATCPHWRHRGVGLHNSAPVGGRRVAELNSYTFRWTIISTEES